MAGATGGWCPQDRAARPGGYARVESPLGGREGSAEGLVPVPRRRSCLQQAPPATSLPFPFPCPGDQCWGSGVCAGALRQHRVEQGGPETSCMSIREGAFAEWLKDSCSAMSPVPCAARGHPPNMKLSEDTHPSYDPTRSIPCFQLFIEVKQSHRTDQICLQIFWARG